MILKKQNLCAVCILLLLLFLLLYPQEALPAARDGMQLWLNTLLPTLLPFLILTGFLIHTELISALLSPLAPVFRFLFGLSVNGGYVLLLGLLCGYPMGAKLALDLYLGGKIEKEEAEYLLTFSNNASPAFLIGYVAQNILKGKGSIAFLFCILLTSDLICMLFFRFFIYKKNFACIPGQKKTSSPAPTGAIMDVSIMNGFETITRLGGYILLFSILSAFISHYWLFDAKSRYLLLGFLELTTGLHLLANAGFPDLVRCLLAITMTAFGGLCIMAQTKSVLNGKLSFPPYAFAKCLNAAVTAALILCFYYLN